MEIKYDGLKVLVAGCGAIGKRHIEILKGLGVGEIVIFDPSEKTVSEIMTMFEGLKSVVSYEDGLKENPDAVFILTPTKLHIPMAIQAIESGAHVFIEKPLSNSSEGAEELKKAGEKYGKKIMIGFCFRYHEALLKAKSYLESGKIGRLVCIRSLMGEDFPSIHPEYREMYLSKYSGAFELVHDIDLAIWYANDEIEDVYGVYGAFSDYEFESPDTVEMLMKFKSNTTATVHLDFFQNPRRRTMELIGTEGVITIDFASWDEAYISSYQKETGKWEKEHIKTKRNDMFYDEDREFLDVVISDGRIKCTVDEALKSLMAIERIYKPY